MKQYGIIIFLLALTASQKTLAQIGKDSSFSILINSGMSFARAHDGHLNKWLSKYGYPTEPTVAQSLHFELSAVPAGSRMLFSVRLATIVNAHNLTSFNIFGGAYYGLVFQRNFILFAGLGLGYHNEIVNLNGNLPPDYKTIAQQYNRELSLRRTGVFLEPAIRAFWYPLNFQKTQIGLYGGFGLDGDINSSWKLGYYDRNHGDFNHFKRISKPADQQKASVYGMSYNLGLSARFHID